MPSYVRINGTMIKGVFVKRLTRFSASVRVENEAVESFLPNPGRMSELLTPGVNVVLEESPRTGRRTSYDLIGVYQKRRKISLDSSVPNKLVLEASRNKDLAEFPDYTSIRPEYLYSHTRFDFLLRNGLEPCLLEAKSCTFVKNEVAKFPDTKTVRGRRHLKDLIRAKREGYRACILFIVQRLDAHVFSPDDKTDPEFGKILREAASQGVEIYCYRLKFVKDKVVLDEKVEVKL